MERIERGLAILNRVCLHYLQNLDLYDDDAREIIADAVLSLVGGHGYKGRAIDHVNGDIHDNRPENLRVVTAKENLHSKRIYHWKGGQWRGSKRVYCGNAITPNLWHTADKEKVNCARCIACMKRHGHLPEVESEYDH